MTPEVTIQKARTRLSEINNELTDGYLRDGLTDTIADEAFKYVHDKVKEVLDILGGKPDKEPEFIVIRELIKYPRKKLFTMAASEARNRSNKSGETFIVAKIKRTIVGGKNGS